MAFSAEWLRLRERADHAARSEALTAMVAARVAGQTPVTVVDLATGTGSNPRYLLPRLPGHQNWRLVDHDPLLLTALTREMTTWGAIRGYAARLEGPALALGDTAGVRRLQPEPRDLSVLDDPSLFEARAHLPGMATTQGTPLGRLLVTAAALLDLVSEAWIQALATHCGKARAVALFALTYDGRIVFSPGEPEDEAVRALVNTHQRRDKGFGPAVGPDGTEIAQRAFAAVGYQTRRAPSDWVLGSDEAELQRRLLAGWADAAAQIAPSQARTIAAWRTRRLAHVAAGRSEIRVGHEDLAAWLPERTSSLGQITRVTGGRSDVASGSGGPDAEKSTSNSTSVPMRNTR